jgi:hypothetical protein
MHSVPLAREGWMHSCGAPDSDVVYISRQLVSEQASQQLAVIQTNLVGRLLHLALGLAWLARRPV